ncbi:unnamed protein product, partial [Iphiclides podalirius]
MILHSRLQEPEDSGERARSKLTGVRGEAGKSEPGGALPRVATAASLVSLPEPPHCDGAQRAPDATAPPTQAHHAHFVITSPTKKCCSCVPVRP